ncbi:MAG: hypothetical protein ACOYD1_12730 [Candidatus Nanopelagicales bacterium]
MTHEQLLRGVTHLQLRLLGRLLLDTPEDITPAFAAALLRARAEHEPMPDVRRSELLGLVRLLDVPATAPVTRCSYLHATGVQCDVSADVVLERVHAVLRGREVKACCAPHAQTLLESDEGWTHGVKP